MKWLGFNASRFVASLAQYKMLSTIHILLPKWSLTARIHNSTPGQREIKQALHGRPECAEADLNLEQTLPGLGTQII